MTLHSEQVQGVLPLQADHSLATPILCDYFSTPEPAELVAARQPTPARRGARLLRDAAQHPPRFIDKRRISDSKVEVARWSATSRQDDPPLR